MQDNIDSLSPAGHGAFFFLNQDKPLCPSCITIRKGEHAHKFTRWCCPPCLKHRLLACQVGVLRVSLMIFHLFSDGHLYLTDSMLHGDLVWEPRVHVHQLRLRHDLVLSQRTGRGSHCAHTIEGHVSASPPCLPDQEEVRSAPSPSPHGCCVITTLCRAARPPGCGTVSSALRDSDRASQPRGNHHSTVPRNTIPRAPSPPSTLLPHGLFATRRTLPFSLNNAATSLARTVHPSANTHVERP